MTKMETSKKLLLALLIPTYILSGFVVFGTLLGYSMDSVERLTECLIGCLTIGVSFYYWKAKAENVVKISKKIPKDLQDKIDINNMINMQ